MSKWIGHLVGAMTYFSTAGPIWVNMRTGVAGLLLVVTAVSVMSLPFVAADVRAVGSSKITAPPQ